MHSARTVSLPLSKPMSRPATDGAPPDISCEPRLLRCTPHPLTPVLSFIWNALRYLSKLFCIHLSCTSTAFLIESLQVNITGATGTTTPSGVAFPGAYHTNDPGI